MHSNLNKTFQLTTLMALSLLIYQGVMAQGLPAADQSSQAIRVDVSLEAPSVHPADLALRYAEAMADGKVEEWAALDLACLMRQRQQAHSSLLQASAATAKSCWEATMEAHSSLVADETEPGIIGALGRGTGFGLIHASHQHSDFWKNYPPALAISPAVVKKDPGAPSPLLKVEKAFAPQSAGLVFDRNAPPADVQKTRIDLSVTYPDPLTAPLALLPNEPWWASPVIRRYGPVRTLIVRFTIVRGLKALGYPVDQAVVNEALPNAPFIAEPSVAGILPSSPKWWDHSQSQIHIQQSIQDVRVTDSFQERVRKFQRLLLLNPRESQINALYGTDLYLAFIQDGLAKANMTAPDQGTGQQLGELYWNIQAQTWRQEFTEVAVGHSPTAETFYLAMPALEVAIQGGQGNQEMERRLGALYRWNNDSASALAIHERLLQDIPPQDTLRRAQMLAEISWDRVQWLSWNRRYDHPWMNQAREEAEQSVNLATTPLEKMIAGEALVILDSLAVPRDQARLQNHLMQVRTWHDQLTGVEGIWNHLVGNDLVKSLIPEGINITVPASARSPEVMPNEVHYRIQDRNFFKTWNFDQEDVGGLPSGFSVSSTQKGVAGGWKIAADSHAPSPPNVIMQTSPCNEEPCFQVMFGDQQTHELPDIVVHIRQHFTSTQGEAGIVLAARDSRNFYAVTLNAPSDRLRIYRIEDALPRLLGEGPVQAKNGPWHVLRVQMVNSAHVDHPRLEIYVDGRETTVMGSEPIKGEGHVGLVTTGDTAAQFDGLRVMEMITNRPLSRPAAY
ncbi:MAG: hypothetical protein KC590_11215 [Nitrospira sp.]|nr:hypothetical protein [Nitrospira sp.]